MVVLIIFPHILQTVINVTMLSIGEQRGCTSKISPNASSNRSIIRHKQDRGTS